VTIAKTTALVMALSRLHNFCIDSNTASVPNILQDDPGSIIDIDSINNERPVALLGGGHHFTDTNEMRRNNLVTNNRVTNFVLPRELLHNAIRDGGFSRPAIM
jgi:acyl CoA:acetate/3-ketoacid CoA transferase